MPGKVSPLRLGTHENGLTVVAEVVGEHAVIAARGNGPVRLTPKGAAHLAAWLRAWARPRARLDLWGHGDIARELGVSDGTVTNWRGKPTFPPPAAEPSCGPVWEADLVRAWARERPKAGRPRRAS